MKASELRDKLLSRAKPRVRLAGMVPDFGDIYVKSATLAEQKEILRRAGMKPHPTIAGESVVEDPIRLAVLAVVSLACDVEGTRIFNADDVPAVESFPVDDDYWKVVMQAATAALNPDSKSVTETKADFVAGESAASSSP